MIKLSIPEAIKNPSGKSMICENKQGDRAITEHQKAEMPGTPRANFVCKATSKAEKMLG